MNNEYNTLTIQDVGPGCHLCAIFETDEQQQEVLVSFTRQGLKNNEKVLYIAEPHHLEAMIVCLKDDGLDFEAYQEDGRLFFLTAGQAFIREGAFDSENMPENIPGLLRSETQKAIDEGYAALRVAGDMRWAVNGLPDPDRLMDYEVGLNELVLSSQCLVLCLYDRRVFSESVLLDVLTCHPIAVIGTELVDNMYYIPPQDLRTPVPEKAKLMNRINTLVTRKKIACLSAETEAKYRMLVEGSHDVIYTITADGIVTFVGSQIKQFGYTPEDLISKNFLQFVTPEFRDSIYNRFQEEIISNEAKPVQFKFQSKDGRAHWVEVVPKNHFDDTGSPVFQVGVMRDISERKRLEKALEETENRLIQIGDNLPNGNLYQLVHDPDGHRYCSYISKGCERMFQVTVEDFQKDAGILYDMFSAEDLARVIEAEEHSIKASVPFDFKAPLTLPDGSIKWFHWRSWSKELPDGTRTWDGVCFDITAHKKSEEMLAKVLENLEQLVEQRTEELTKVNIRLQEENKKRIQAQEALQIKEAGLLEAQRIAHLGNWEWNIITGELSWSDEIYRIFGLKPQAFGASYNAFLELVHSDDREAVQNAVNRAIEDPDAHYNIEHRIKRKDGSIRIVHEQGDVTFADDNKPLRMVGTVQDVTEQRQAEMEFRTVADFTYDWEYWEAPDGKINYISPSCKRVSGYNSWEFRDNPLLVEEIVLPEDRVLWDDHRRDARQDFGRKEVQFRIRNKNGEIRWIEHACQPVFDHAGVFMGFRASNRDITFRKNVEEGLRQSKEFNRSVLMSLRDHIAIVDKKGDILDVNERWIEFARKNNIESLESVSHGVNYFDVCQRSSQAGDEFALAAMNGIKQVLDGSTRHFEMEYPCDSTEEKRWFNMTVLPLKGGKGGVIVSHADISMRKAAELKEKRAMDEVRRLKSQLEAESAYLQEEIKLEHNFEHIIGNSSPLKYVLYKVEQVAETDVTVLIQGETGTGKELIARALHANSLRKNRPLIKLNCAALPAQLIESELFGHEKGAFTGADKKKIGRFELANNATLFLDEIGEIPMELQAKLLRALQDGEVDPLGGTRTLKTDVRIIAATNRDLEVEIKNGRFREDLWFRLNLFPLTVPPLRDRPEDIPLLAEWLRVKFSKKYGKKVDPISKSTMEILKKYHWPGNVRELENLIGRAVISASGKRLHLKEIIDKTSFKEASADPAVDDKTLEEMEREYILKILKKTQWRIEGQQGAALILDLKPSTLRSRMKKLLIRKPY